MMLNENADDLSVTGAQSHPEPTKAGMNAATVAPEEAQIKAAVELLNGEVQADVNFRVRVGEMTITPFVVHGKGDRTLVIENFEPRTFLVQIRNSNKVEGLDLGNGLKSIGHRGASKFSLS